MRKILHIDADCFFAAVEVRDNPRLRGRAIAVGGDPERRGVIATCSYEARRAGVRSAMPSAHALRLCPDLLILPPNMARYKDASRAMRQIFAEYAEVCEPVSLDEAYLDVSHCEAFKGSATWIAQAIQHKIAKELGLTVSAGVAPVKFLAKVASDWRKPAGFFAVPPAAVEAFTAELGVGKLPGVGPVTAQKMQRFGLYCCRDIREFGLENMRLNFGSAGPSLYERAWGKDERPVQVDHTRKSVSVERTFDRDLALNQLSAVVPELLQSLDKRFTPLLPDYRPNNFFVKLKFDDFQQTTMETALPRSLARPGTDGYCRLLHAAWTRVQRPVRLVGLGMRLSPTTGGSGSLMQQLSLF